VEVVTVSYSYDAGMLLCCAAWHMCVLCRLLAGPSPGFSIGGAKNQEGPKTRRGPHF